MGRDARAHDPPAGGHELTAEDPYDGITPAREQPRELERPYASVRRRDGERDEADRFAVQIGELGRAQSDDERVGRRRDDAYPFLVDAPTEEAVVAVED